MMRITACTSLLLACLALPGCVGRDPPAPHVPVPLAIPLTRADLEGLWQCGRAATSEFRDGVATVSLDSAGRGNADSVLRASYELEGNDLHLTAQSLRTAARGGAATAPGAAETHPDQVTVDRLSNFTGNTFHYERVSFIQDGRAQPEHSSIGTGGDCVRAG